MFSPIIGGAEARAEKQARHLRTLGHEVTVITLRLNQRWRRREILDGLPVVRIGGIFKRNGRLRAGRLGHIPTDIALFWHLWRLRRSFDIIHVFQISSLAAVAALIGKLTQTPVVISTQCSAPNEELLLNGQCSTRLLADTLPDAEYLRVAKQNVVADDMTYLTRTALGGSIMLRFLQRSNACFQALSSRSVSSLISHGFRPQHIVHISGSVDTERFHPAPDRHSNAANPERIVLCVARLEYSKGVDVLLHAWGRLLGNIAPQQQQPTLWIVGDGVLKARLERIATELHVEDSIKFLGTRKDVLALLQQAEAFVLPSRWEGMPNALLEAMACGLPCVATRVSGSEDIITDGINGLLVPPAQPAAMAHALQRLIEDADFAQQMGEAARATVKRDYQLSTIVNQCLALYKQLIKQQQQKGKAHEQSTYIHRYPNVSSPGRRSRETGTDARP